MTQSTVVPIDVERVSQELSKCLIGSSIVHRDVVTSTMDEARRLAESSVEEGTVIVAEEQTGGRGRFQRRWVTHKGLDLLLSVVLRPEATLLPQVNMAATLAVSNTVAESGGLVPTIKWPNDVRVGGRKISGILVESVSGRGGVGHAVVGIGLNVNTDTSADSEIADTATSIAMETGHSADRTDVLVRLLRHMDRLYARAQQGHVLTAEWSAQLETVGQRVRVTWGEKVVEGLAKNVDDQGNLVVEGADGARTTVVAGEVTLQS